MRSTRGDARAPNSPPKQKRRPEGRRFKFCVAALSCERWLRSDGPERRGASWSERADRLHAGRACEPACERGARPRPSGEPSSQRASRSSCAASFHGRRLRAAAFSSARAAPDQRYYRERLLAKVNRPFEAWTMCLDGSSGAKTTTPPTSRASHRGWVYSPSSGACPLSRSEKPRKPVSGLAPATRPAQF